VLTDNDSYFYFPPSEFHFVAWITISNSQFTLEYADSKNEAYLALRKEVITEVRLLAVYDHDMQRNTLRNLFLLLITKVKTFLSSHYQFYRGANGFMIAMVY